jgi:uncharacterized protein
MKTHPLKKYQSKIDLLAQKHHIDYLALFGSRARGDSHQDSDLDLLINFKKIPGFVELYNVKKDLRDTFQKKIDLITVGGINKHIKPYIIQDIQDLYGQRPSSIS